MDFIINKITKNSVTKLEFNALPYNVYEDI